MLAKIRTKSKSREKTLVSSKDKPKSRSKEESATQPTISKEKPKLKGKEKEKDHHRKRANRSSEITRKKKYEIDIEEWYIRSISYRCDTTRYRSKYVNPVELTMSYFFPSMLLLIVVYSFFVSFAYLGDWVNKHPDIVLQDLSSITQIKYDKYEIVDDIDKYLDNSIEHSHYDCPGLSQGEYHNLDTYEVNYMRENGLNIKKAMKALSFRWVYPVHNIINMTLNCPPSVIIELHKK